MAQVVQQERADGLQELQRAHLVLSALREAAILADIEKCEVFGYPLHELEDLLAHLESVRVVLGQRAGKEQAPQDFLKGMSF